MKKLFTLFFLGTVTFCANAQVVTTELTAPKTVAVTEEALGMIETTYDFGKIPQGKPVTHIFEVLNNGKDSLKIDNVQASCGCTTPEWNRDKTLTAGEKTNITVGFNAASEGSFTKFITISYNKSHTKQITIHGEVYKTPAASAPENKDLKSLKED